MDFLATLNPEQRLAVESSEPAIAVIAGPGTGKTKTLTARIAYLIQSGRAGPGQIVAMTFTNKAAAEMRQRLIVLLDGGQVPHITTFHAFCLNVLQQAGQAEQQFVDEAERLAIIRELPKADSLAGLTVRELALRLSRFKNSFDAREFDLAIGRLAARYDEKLREYELADFDNLLVEAREYFETNVAPGFAHLLIDEFQDTNELQYDLMQRLGTQNIMVIGDPMQSIYGFRGASGNIFKRFQRDFGGATITLRTNYRSHSRIVGLAKAVFPAKLQLEPHSKTAGEANIIKTLNEYTEAGYIVDTIQTRLGGTDLLSATSDDGAVHHFRDFAILSRTHHAARMVIRKLAESGIPYQVAGEESPYAAPVIKALIFLTHWKLKGYEPTDRELRTLSALKPRPRRIREILRDLPETLTDMVDTLIKAFQLEAAVEKHKDAYRQLQNSLVRFHQKPVAAAEYLENLIKGEFYDPRADAVAILTIHAAKGLEFKHVFLCAVEEGILPHGRDGTDIDEEQRLFYVAVTRAKERLDILYATERARQPSRSSRFLQLDGFARTTDPYFESHQKRRVKRAQKRAQTRLFEI